MLSFCVVPKAAYTVTQLTHACNPCQRWCMLSRELQRSCSTVPRVVALFNMCLYVGLPHGEGLGHEQLLLQQLGQLEFMKLQHGRSAGFQCRRGPI